MTAPLIETHPDLDADGRLALQHWHQHRPRFYTQKYNNGTLIQIAKLASDRTFEETDALHNELLRSKKYSNSGDAWRAAREVVLQRYILLPDEETVPMLEEVEGLLVWNPDTSL